jgi:Fe-S cluster biogenesis protein NfuA
MFVNKKMEGNKTESTSPFVHNYLAGGCESCFMVGMTTVQLDMLRSLSEIGVHQADPEQADMTTVTAKSSGTIDHRVSCS